MPGTTRLDKNLLQQWEALSSTNEVLFYKKSSQKLESMAYSNGAERFFKTIWYYMCGYTKNDDLVLKGVSQLIDNSMCEIKRESFVDNRKLDGFLQTVKNTNDVALRNMITEYNADEKIARSLAAQLLQAKIAQFLEGLSEKTVSSKTENQAEKPAEKPASSSEASPGSNAAESLQKKQVEGGTANPQPVQPPVMPSGPLPTPPKAMGISPKVPPPPMQKSPEEMKRAAIEKIEKEISTKKRIISYLELVALQDTKEYKEYKNAKVSLEMYQEKIAEHNEKYGKVSIAKLNKAILSLEVNLQEAKQSGAEVVIVMQEGAPKEYSLQIASETHAAWKQIAEDHQTNQSCHQKYLALQKEKGNATLPYEGSDISCLQIDKRVRELQVELAKEIEENAGKMDLKAQGFLLKNLENKLAIQKGEKIEKKPSTFSLKKQSQADGVKASPSMQEIQGGLAFAASSKAALKLNTMPSIFKI